MIKTRLLWAAWGPDYANFRGWWLSVLWRPRPDETPEGEMTRSTWRLDVRRDGPDFMWRGTGIQSQRWTGMQYDWPPTISVQHGIAQPIDKAELSNGT